MHGGIDHERPTVSVCVTAYRHERYLGACLDSILAQDFGGTLDIVVGDDASPDGTAAVVAGYADRHPGVVRAFLHPTNRGPSDNIRFLIGQARGHYIAHMDGDDLWAVDKLRRQLAVLAADPAVEGVYSNAAVIDADAQPLGVFNAGVGERIGLDELLRRGNFLHHSSMLYRAAAAREFLAMDGVLLDYRLHLCLARRGPLAYVDAPLASYRWRNQGSVIMHLLDMVYGAQIDTFAEAARHAPPQHALAAGMGRFWGKLLLNELRNGRVASALQWQRKLRGDPSLRDTATLAWFARHTFAAPLHMLGAVWARRLRGQTQRVFFP
jgi:glycosyltransferase involved in cell wall biosynthesis